MECISTIVSAIEPSTHMGYIIYLTKYVREMNQMMRQLDGIRVGVEKRMDTNNRNNLEVPDGVPGWLKEVEELKKDVERISNNRNITFNLILRYQTGKDASMITLEMERLIKENHDRDWTNIRKPPGKVYSYKESTSASPSCDTQNDFKSRDRIFKDAMEFLKQDHKAKVIALCGMGGVGKTTMMEQLEKAVVAKKMFNWVVKVVIRENPDMISIQKAIAEHIREPLDADTLTVRSDLLRKSYEHILKKGATILFMLDDIWEMVELKDIGLRPLPNGCKLLLTSRNQNVCTQIAIDANAKLETLEVKALEDTEAQYFFSQITEISKEDDPQLNEIGCEIVRRCGYLPLAIKLIATTLKLQNKAVWRDALNRLKKNDLDNNVQNIIEMSYNHLKEENDKEVFLICGLFPDDCNIPIEELARYAWGLKLLKEFSTFGEARDHVDACVSRLKNVHMLMDSDYTGCVKMHDLVLAFVVGRYSKDDHGWIINHGDTTKRNDAMMNKSCKRISLTCMGMSEFPLDFKYPDLSLLKLMQGDASLVFPEDFYDGMEELEVVAYEDMRYPLLPRPRQCSRNLQTLCLHDCSLPFDLSPIGDLVNLEVLSFSNCRIRKLPSSIGNLKKLRLLDLTVCVHLCIDEGALKGLRKLEELYMRVYDKRPPDMRVYDEKKFISFTDANFEELTEVSKNLFALELEFIRENAIAGKMSFKKLERFKISMGRFLERTMGKDKHSFENTLMLAINRSELLASKVNELFQKTEVLHLEVNDMNDFEDVLVKSRHPHLDSFCNLRFLNASNCANLKFLFTVSMANGLKKLEHLTISSCSVLEVLVNLEDSGAVVIKFPKLKSLHLKNLPELVRLCNIVIELPELMKLRLDGLSKFTSIYSRNEGTSSILNKQVVIPKLETLEICRMENLKEIWPCSEEANECKLREITVKECNSLVNLFPNNPMRLLRHLETLDVDSCGSIEVLFEIDFGCAGEIEQQGHIYSSLRSISVRLSHNLREIWRVKGVNACDLHVSAFQAVESIRVYNCNRFRNIFTPTTISFDFRALDEVRIDKHRWDDSATRAVEEGNDVSKEEISEISDNIACNIAFSSDLMWHSFYHIRDLSLGDYRGVDVIFEIESATYQQLLPHLQSLRLEKMQRMSDIWKCNWNKFLSFQPNLFHSLTTVEVYHCHRIKYLLSPLMARHLSNLKSIEIQYCHGIEEVVSGRDDGDEEMASSVSTTTLFPHLELLKLYDLPSLQCIDGGGSWRGSNKTITSNYNQFQPPPTCCSFLCQYSKKIAIFHCGALSSVFPSHVVGRIQMLEELEVDWCWSLKHVFEVEGVNSNINVGSQSSDAMTIPRSTNLSLLQLPNLKIVRIIDCKLLEHVLITSALESLRNLAELTVKRCEAMQVIVKEYGEYTTTSKVVVFPRLKSLTLGDLPNLKAFLLGMDEFKFEWPLLDEFNIYGCPWMMRFTPGHCTTPKLNYVHTAFGKHSLECGLNFHLTHETTPQPINLLQFPWSFSNLIEAHVNFLTNVELHGRRILFPRNELLKLQNLEKLHLEEFYSIEEVFETTQGQGTDDDVNKTQTVVMFPNLKELILAWLSSPRCIWKSSRWITLNFPNLTKVSIKNCTHLEHVFTYGMVGSLLQLQEVEVRGCRNMEVIIKQREDYETEVNEIVFPCLKSLTFSYLKNLKGFSLGSEVFQWPSLHTLEIKDCPNITVFTSQESSTPILKVIDTSFGRCDASQGLNSFIRAMKEEGFKFGEE